MFARLLSANLLVGLIATGGFAQVPTASLPTSPATGGFIPGGQGMGGQAMTLDQYMRARYLQSLAGRHGHSGPRRGFDQFGQQQQLMQQQAMQQAAAAAQAQQSTKVARQAKPLPGVKISDEERRARVQARAADDKAKRQDPKKPAK